LRRLRSVRGSHRQPSAFKRHKISHGRVLELLHGAATADDAPAEDRVLLESMRAQFDLD